MSKIIYLISVLENMQGFFVLTLLAMVFGLPISFAIVSCYNDGIWDEDDKINWFAEVKKKLKLIIAVLVICVSGLTFIPGKDTMYAMLITEKVLTRENYNLTVNEAKKLIDYTVEKIEQTKEK